MRITRRGPRLVLVVLAALLAALLVSACGGSSNSGGSSKSASNNASATTTTSTTAKTGSAARTAFTACLKQHGVTLPGGGRGGFGGFRHGTTTNGTPPTATTPGGGAPGGGRPGGGRFFGGGGGSGAGNSKFAKAFQACRLKLGGSGFRGGSGAGPGGAGAPGARNFRPRFTTAALKSYVACIRKNGYAAMPEPKASSNGSFFPASVERNAKFQAANRKCESILLKGLRRPAAGAGSGGGAYTISGSSTTSST